MPLFSKEDWQTLGFTIAGLAATVVGFQRWRAANSADRRDQAASDASGAVIGMLRSEVERLADQNDRLLRLVHQLQNQVVEIRNENAELRNIVERFAYGTTDAQALDQRR